MPGSPGRGVWLGTGGSGCVSRVFVEDEVVGEGDLGENHEEGL